MRSFAFLSETNVTRFLLVVSAGLGIFSLILYVHLVFHPWQHEFREATTSYISSLIREGINPFRFEAQPQAAYAYGIVFPYLTAALSFFTQNDLLASRLVVAFCNFLLYGLIFVLLRKEKIPLFWILSLLALSFCASIWHNGFAFPNAPVALFMFLALYVPWSMGFSYSSLFLSASISVLALGTKQYGILSFPVLAAYLFFRVSYRKALIFCLIQSFSLALFIGWMYQFFPTWFFNAFFSFRCMAEVYTGEPWYMYNQCRIWFADNLILLPFLAGGIFQLSRIKTEEIQWPGSRAVFPSAPGTELFLWGAFAGLAAFILRFGYHTGASGGSYLYQLALPCWLVGAGVWGPRWFPIRNLQLLALLCLVWYGKGFVSRYVVTMHHLNDNRKVMETLEKEVKSIKTLYASPETAGLMLLQGRRIYNSGQTEYFSEVAGCQTPFLKQSQSAQQRFDRMLQERCLDQHFDVILQTRDYFGFKVLKPEWLAGYKLKKSVFIPMVLGGWHMDWWEPTSIQASNTNLIPGQPKN